MNKQYEFYTIDIFTKGDLKGYANGEIVFQYNNTEYRHEFLYRFDDKENGDNYQLVSIDYGLRVPYIMEIWDKIEKELTDYVQKHLVQ